MFEAKGNIVESPPSDAGQGKVLLDKWLANTFIAIEKYSCFISTSFLWWNLQDGRDLRIVENYVFFRKKKCKFLKHYI